MGSIVGGLYSIGYTADEIEQFAASVDWDAILSNKIPLSEITFEEKAYYGRYIAELPVDGIKVGLPKGLIEGQQLSELLSRITRSVHDIEDFNELPIPFACVAADIATGEARERRDVGMLQHSRERPPVAFDRPIFDDGLQGILVRLSIIETPKARIVG